MTGLALLLFAVVAGAFLPLQAGINARLAHFVGGPVRASMISYPRSAVLMDACPFCGRTRTRRHSSLRA